MDTICLHSLLESSAPWLPRLRTIGKGEDILFGIRCICQAEHELPTQELAERMEKVLSQKPGWKRRICGMLPSDHEEATFPLWMKLLFAPAGEEKSRQFLLSQTSLKNLFLIREKHLFTVLHGLHKSPLPEILGQNRLFFPEKTGFHQQIQLEAHLHLPALSQLKYTNDLPAVAQALHIQPMTLFHNNGRTFGAWYLLASSKWEELPLEETTGQFFKTIQMVRDAEIRARRQLRKHYLPALFRRIQGHITEIRKAQTYPLPCAQQDLSLLLLAADLEMLPNCHLSDLNNAIQILLAPSPTLPNLLPDQCRLDTILRLLPDIA